MALSKFSALHANSEEYFSKDAEIALLRNQLDDEQNLCCKLQISVRDLIQKIEKLEELYENEQRGRQRVIGETFFSQEFRKFQIILGISGREAALGPAGGVRSDQSASG